MQGVGVSTGMYMEIVESDKKNKEKDQVAVSNNEATLLQDIHQYNPYTPIQPLHQYNPYTQIHTPRPLFPHTRDASVAYGG